MPYKDPKKKREYQRTWYARNSKLTISKVAKRRKKIKFWFQKYRNNLKCERCGENHPATLDFHHKGNKKKGINFMFHWGYSIDTIKNEIKKCKVLCANCHRKLHYSLRSKNNNI